MKKLLIAAALAFAFTGSAYAGNSNGCQGNCSGNPGDVTNQGGVGNGGSGVGIGVGFGQGGNGGQGGAGGQGGSVIGSGNSSNLNTNLNANVNGNHNANDNRNDNTNVNANANTNRNTNKQGQAQGQQQGQGQAQSSRNDNRSSARNEGNNSAQSVTVQGDTYEAARIPVATAYAAPLAASNGTCMGSSSVGGQGVGFGISIGSTWNDESCDMRYDAEALRLAGMPAAALARLCQKAEIAQAMAAAGTACPAKNVVATAPVQVAQRAATEQEKAVGYTGTDPVVRKRLGLPPL